MLTEEMSSLHRLNSIFYICWPSNVGRVFSTDEIFERVWNEKMYEANNTVMVHIRRIGKKLRWIPGMHRFIKTVWGVGYKIEE